MTKIEALHSQNLDQVAKLRNEGHRFVAKVSRKGNGKFVVCLDIWHRFVLNADLPWTSVTLFLQFPTARDARGYIDHHVGAA